MAFWSAGTSNILKTSRLAGEGYRNGMICRALGFLRAVLRQAVVPLLLDAFAVLGKRSTGVCHLPTAPTGHDALANQYPIPPYRCPRALRTPLSHPKSRALAYPTTTYVPAAPEFRGMCIWQPIPLSLGPTTPTFNPRAHLTLCLSPSRVDCQIRDCDAGILGLRTPLSPRSHPLTKDHSHAQCWPTPGTHHCAPKGLLPQCDSQAFDVPPLSSP
jgi:hypothetical protein